MWKMIKFEVSGQCGWLLCRGEEGIGKLWVMVCTSILKFQEDINNSTSHCNVAESSKN
jgi:hypothetical protein